MDISAIAKLFDQGDRDLWLLTAAARPRRGGLIATFVIQASIVPEIPRVLVGLSKQHFTWELLEASRAFTLHLFAEDHLDWVWRFGMQSGREFDKLAGVAHRIGLTGSPILAGAIGWLDCRVEAKLDIGDRTVYVAEVLDGQMVRDAAPLTFKRLLQLAPPDKLQELKKQLGHDSAGDAAAIHSWRQSNGGFGP